MKYKIPGRLKGSPEIEPRLNPYNQVPAVAYGSVSDTSPPSVPRIS